MIKHFYSFIVETDTLFSELDTLELSKEEKNHLSRIAESMIHHAIIDLVLSELSPEDRKEFLTHLHSKHHEKIWKLLNTKVENIEVKIKKAAKDLEKEFLKDIKEIK